VIVFDWYETSRENTKNSERLRRQTRCIGREINFEINTKIIFSQDKFLSNPSNKSKLINMVCENFYTANILTKIANDDADELIISIALDMHATHKNVIIVGEDIDLLVIMTQRAAGKNLFFLKPGREALPKKMYDSNSFAYPDLKCLIAFMHAFGGCDTTSAFFKHGKSKIVKILQNDTEIRSLAIVFNDPEATPQNIANVGNKIIAKLYSLKKENHALNTLR